VNLIDVLVGVAIVWFTARAFFRGFLTQVLVVASVVVGLVTAFGCHEWLRQWWGRGGDAHFLALPFVVAPVAGLVVFGVFQILAERWGRAANASLLGPVNRGAGLVLGLATGLAISALRLLLLVSAPFPKPVATAVHASWSGPRLLRGGRDLSRRTVGIVPGSAWWARAFRRASKESVRSGRRNGADRHPADG